MNHLSTIGASLFLLSGSALAYEVLLVRLLAVTRFHHLAFMVLSLALLGYGVSGVFLAYGREMLLRRFQVWFCVFAGSFASGAVLCFQLSQRIAIFPGQWIWSPGEMGRLAALYLILCLPFAAAACAVGLTYCAKGKTVAFVYKADLLGAGAGSLAALAALFLPQARGLWLPWCGGLAAAALAALPHRKKLAACLILAALLGPALNIRSAVTLLPSADKPLSAALSAAGARVVVDAFSPLGRTTVTRNSLAPYRYAPGLSLSFEGLVPEQWAAFVDGESIEPLLPDVQPSDSAYLDYLPEALAFRLVHNPRVLVLETVAMEHIVRAAGRGAAAIDVVVADPTWAMLLQKNEMAPIGRFFASEPVRLITGSARGYLKSIDQRYDLIVIGPPVPSSLRSDHLHTVEAFAAALASLTPRGVLVISGMSDLPPRAGLRLLTTAAAALRAAGVAEPADRLAMIRSLQTVHLLVKKSALTSDDVAVIRRFCRERRFDPVWFPTIAEEEVDRYNRMGTPVFYQAAGQLLGPAADLFQQSYKFDISPVFDDRPYFSRFLKFETLPELLAMRGSGAMGLLSLAEPVLGATFGQALLLSLILVWLPLRRLRAGRNSGPRGAVFVLLGIGFMLAEWAVLEKLSLFLNEPVVAVAVTLAAFLAMAGLGGGISARLLRVCGQGAVWVGAAALSVAGLVILYAAALPLVFEQLPVMPLVLRGIAALLLITPLALAMGLPFPLAVAALKENAPRSVAWAWGLNGCGSMIGPVLGVILAMYCGITVVLWAASGCYALVFILTLRK